MATANELKRVIKKYEKEHPDQTNAVSEAYLQGAKDGYAFCKEEFIRILQGIGIPRPNEIENENWLKKEKGTKVSVYMQGYRRARNELRKCKDIVFRNLKESNED